MLARGDTSRKRELVHRIGAIEWHDLGDIAAATATYRGAIEEDADDAEAYDALANLYAQGELWNELCELLETRLARSEGAVARSLRARLAEVAASRGDEARARTQSARLLEDPELVARAPRRRRATLRSAWATRTSRARCCAAAPR